MSDFNIRTRNFACVLYLDSMPFDYLDILNNTHIPFILSPLHDKDFNANGEKKKPHYHLLLLFDSVKTMKQAKDIFKLVNGVGCEIINSLRGYVRYLCHLDNPEKAQYSPKGVKTSCGLDYSALCNLSLDRYKAIKEMITFCTDNKVYSFSKLSLYASEFNFEWFKILCDSGAVFIKAFLQSLYFDHFENSKNFHFLEEIKPLCSKNNNDLL